MVCLQIFCLDDGYSIKNSLSDQSDIVMINEKGFNGETIIELFVNSIPAMAIIASLLIEKIKNKKVSKIVIDGDKLELEGVSEELIKDILSKKMSERTSNE